MNPNDTVQPRPGAIVFVAILGAIALLLLSQIGSQTKWVDGVKFIAQPSFWPGLCLTGMLAFCAAMTVQLVRSPRPQAGAIRRELLVWLRPIEYAAYFMVYVFAVGELGYLIATLMFCPLLVWRSGFRRFNHALVAMAFGIVVVLFFKTFLRIKIPGGALYEFFPDGLRNFMILYF